jgi:hypothetical protein
VYRAFNKLSDTEPTLRSCCHNWFPRQYTETEGNTKHRFANCLKDILHFLYSSHIREVKVKLSLCKTGAHAEAWTTAPRIPRLAIRWRCEFCYTPQQLYRTEKRPGLPPKRRLSGPPSRCGRFAPTRNRTKVCQWSIPQLDLQSNWETLALTNSRKEF